MQKIGKWFSLMLTLVLVIGALTVSPFWAADTQQPDRDLAETKVGAFYYDYYDVKSDVGNVGEDAAKLFDGSVTTKWCVDVKSFPISMTFRTKEAVVVDGYMLTTGDDNERYHGRNPNSWMIEGSNAGLLSDSDVDIISGSLKCFGGGNASLIADGAVTVDNNADSVELINTGAGKAISAVNGITLGDRMAVTVPSGGSVIFDGAAYDIADENGSAAQVSIENITPVILGDADGSGEIESVDATFVQRYTARIETPYSAARLMRGDVDGSGELTITDVTAIQYYLCCLRTDYPVGTVIS